MKLLTKELQRALPPLYTNEDNPDPLIVCKFFTPASNWTWYVLEASPVNEDGETIQLYEGSADVLFFGLVDGFEEELGYFSLNGLESAHKGKRGLLSLPVERDLYWTPKPLSKVRKHDPPERAEVTLNVKRLVALAREYQAHVEAGALMDVEEGDPKLRQRIAKALAPFQTW